MKWSRSLCGSFMRQAVSLVHHRPSSCRSVWGRAWKSSRKRLRQKKRSSVRLRSALRCAFRLSVVASWSSLLTRGSKMRSPAFVRSRSSC